MPEVSIIVPVFRVEKYLEKCIHSLLKQTFSDFEVILVDDGSDDRSGDICDLAAQRDPRIVVIHQENAGVSAARNRGLQRATGKYIVFVDSDDYVADTYLKNLISAPTEFDYVAAGCYVQKADMNWEKWSNESVMLALHDIVNDPIKINNVPMGMVWARRYKRSIIQDNAIQFNETIKRGEDVLFNVQYLNFGKEIMTINVNDYFCCHRNDSVTVKVNFNYFRWSMLPAIEIGKIIGYDNDVFYGRIWHNAMTVCDHYFQAASDRSAQTKLRMIRAIFEVCANSYVRKSLPYAKKNCDRKKALCVQFFVYPFLPFIYPIYAKIKEVLESDKARGNQHE